MAQIKVAFWNLQNLFDTTPNAIATDLEFTPAEGWTQAAFEAKRANLAAIIALMHGGTGPDLLGVCEVENTGLAKQLAHAAGLTNHEVAEVAATDQRGINVSLIYSKAVFAPVAPASVRPHVVHVRYPTRDILQVPLVLLNGTKLDVLVNHWPSRRLGQYESEPLRITVAELAGRIVDEILKFSRDELFQAGGMPPLADLKARWDRNVLLMGDFNDEPHSRSVVDHLRASKDEDRVEEELKVSGATPELQRKSYLGQKPYLFDCMWPLLGTPDLGSHHFSDNTNTANLLDQFMISRGLFYGRSGLRLKRDSVKIFRAPPMTTPKGRPRPFDKKAFAASGKSGYSDHFPIEAVIEVL